MVEYLQFLINGMIAGGILALVSVGYNLIYGIMRFINFAHGEVVTASAFFLFFLFSDSNLPLPLAIFLTIALTVLLGLSINKFVYKPLRSAPSLSLLVAAISVSLIIQALLLIFFGADSKFIKNPFPQKTIEFFGAIITPIQIAIISVSLIIVVLLELFLKKTKIGKEIRATADNPELAATIGIDTERVIAFTFLIASLLAAIAGIMISFEQPVNYLIGVNLGVRAFAASVVGGIASIPGSFIGGYFIGIIENLAISCPFGPNMLCIPSGYKDAIGFFILIVFLLFRPNGILNKELRRL